MMFSTRLRYLIFVYIFLVIAHQTFYCAGVENENLKVFTVATEETDGYQRYIRSAQFYGINVETLGLGEDWKGGDMRKPGGGFKINLLRQAVEPLKDQDDTIVMFTDSYDVIFTAGPNKIIENFKESGAKILFSAEKYCWPDKTLANSYPNVSLRASKYLNSGGYMGYANYIYKMLNTPVNNQDDDQLYFTKIFLNENARESLEIQLDTESKIFQNLYGAENDVTLKVDLKTNDGVLQNLHFLNTPSVIHGNGLSKIELNAFGNYLAGTFKEKCLICEEGHLTLDENNLPVVTISLMVTKLVPFYEEFLKKIYALNYPKSQVHLFIHSMFPFHDDTSKSFISNFGNHYRSAKLVLSTDELSERRGRQLAIQQVFQKKSDYLFSVDAEAHIDDIELLRDLLIYNRSFIAPVISKHNELWSNFWGALSDSGYYARSHDYVDILKRNIIGMWNVPYVSSCYLIKSAVLSKINFKHEVYDADMAMCNSLREAGIFMYVTNERMYGHLVNAENFDINVAKPDFYTLFTNQIDWEQKYIHPKYFDQLKPNTTQLQPCSDVYWFQVTTEKFCEDLIAIMENFGKWSDGSNNDERVQGGYEAVPTRDIHMKQVGLEPLWMRFLQLYVRPLVEKVFTGYFSDPPKALMNFVVRYRPDEQPYLRPHHDASTYTINIALNRAGIDYEGGGCNFLRYNCSITATKMGWMLMHPGRLTHFHEGLKVTKGTRYIMISFVDP